MTCRIVMRMVAFAIVAMIAATTVEARILVQKSRGCLDGGAETWTLFEDDCTGEIFSIYVDCLGNTYLNVPEPQWRAMFLEDQNPFPDHFWELVERADLNTPGRPSGIYLINIHGERVDFRNPRDAAERERLGAPCTPITTLE